MNDQFTTCLHDNLQVIKSIVANHGIYLETGSDPAQFSKHIKEQPERHGIAPMFSAHCNDDMAEDLLWMVGHDREGTLVHTQAIKLFNTGSMLFESFLKDQIWNIFPAGYSPDYALRNFYLSSEAQNISGRLTYHGELWLEKSYRGGCLAMLLTRLMLTESLLRWSPDYFTGFQRPLSACRGLGARESYMRLEQRSIIMHNDKLSDLFEIWLVWMTSAEAAFNLRLPAKFIQEMFEPDEPVTHHLHKGEKPIRKVA